MDLQVNYGTKEDKERLVAEYGRLEKEIKRAMARPIERSSVDDPSSDAADKVNEVERLIAARNSLYETIRGFVVVENEESLEGVVCIGDLVTVLTFDNDEIRQVKLIGGTPVLNENGELCEISIKSPMGKAILGKNVGDVVSYSTSKKTFTAQILSKEKTKEQAQEESQPE